MVDKEKYKELVTEPIELHLQGKQDMTQTMLIGIIDSISKRLLDIEGRLEALSVLFLQLAMRND